MLDAKRKAEVERLYKENYNKLKNFFIKKNFIFDVEDLIHQVFIKFMQNIDKVKNYNSYLFSIARNLMIDMVRTKKRVYPINNDILTKEELDSKIEFERIISNLSEEERFIIKMKIVDNLTFKEISQILNKNINTVISKFNKAIKKLSKFVDQEVYKFWKFILDCIILG